MARAVAFGWVILALTIATTLGEGPSGPEDQVKPSIRFVDDLPSTAEEEELDPYVASESTHKSRLIRNSHQLGEETFRSLYERSVDEDSKTASRPVRRRSGGRRRRPLDPERRRQLLLRRQKLGLPVRKFSRGEDDEHHHGHQEGQQPDSPSRTESVEDVSVLVATPGPKMVRVFPDVFTTTEPPSTTPTATSTTSRFPSFSAASRLRQRFKTIRDEWGMRTDAKPDEEEEEGEEHPAEEPRSRVTSRARVVTASTRGANRQDKRLRYRPVLVRKKLRSKVKVTSPDPPALEPVPVDYDEDQEGSYELETQGYDSFPEEPLSVQDSFHTEPYHFSSTEPSIYETSTKPRHTPVPKKVALEIPTQVPTKKHFFQELSDGPSKSSFRHGGGRVEPKRLTPVPLGPELTPTTLPEYFSEVPHVTEQAFVTDRAPVPSLAPEPGFDYAQQAGYAQDYAQEQLFAEEPIYDLNYDTSEEYSSEDYDDKPGIFDQYKYGYSVASKDTGNYHARSEARDGETVSGSYKVALPDGRVQIVTYVADDNGFRADVNYEGEAVDQTSHSPPSGASASSFSPSETHPGGRPEDGRPPFRQHAIAEDHFDEDRHDFHHDLHQQRPRASAADIQPQLHPTRLLPRPVVHPPQRPFEKPVTLVPDLEDDLTPTQAPRPINQNLRFHDAVHVSTPSPNPFRLVVEKSRASTYAPPIHSATISAFRSAMILHNARELTTPTSTTTRARDVSAFTQSYEAGERHTTTTTPPSVTFKPLSGSHEQDNSLLSTTPPPTLKLRPAFSHNNFYRPSGTTPRPPVTQPPKSETTNAHTMRPPHSPTDAPDETSGIYHYHSHDDDPREGETTLYNPDPKSTAFIHALGRTHAVPILLPVDRRRERAPAPAHHRPPPIVTTSTPRTYYLNTPAVVFPSHGRSTPAPAQVVRMIRVTPAPPLQYASEEGVEIIRGDALRRRLTLKVPEPHETDIYPTPRPRIMIL
ncbi:uncharacterized protein LOC135199324 [Macrobrachium nipponense]|uniref:uncharacterized protein LOC135199324 n=1 Tax=Macrobrachium nipponense TaxID=159736 RepID=UPI0030C7FE85